MLRGLLQCCTRNQQHQDLNSDLPPRVLCCFVPTGKVSLSSLPQASCSSTGLQAGSEEGRMLTPPSGPPHSVVQVPGPEILGQVGQDPHLVNDLLRLPERPWSLEILSSLPAARVSVLYFSTDQGPLLASIFLSILLRHFFSFSCPSLPLLIHLSAICASV